MASTRTIDESFDELAATVRGSVLRPDSPGWPEEVAAYNLAVAHTPRLVVVAADAQDVAAAVRYAGAHALPVAVQATGHGAEVAIDGGLLVSTRALDSVTIDPARRTATVGAGVRWRAVLDAAAPHGLAPLSGSTSDVSVVGYTLGGGLPILGRTFGFSADHVVSLELVTADGRVRQVDAVSEPDLFWALRGGKGNLGIVTEMTVELVEVDTVFGGGIFYAAEHIPTLLHAFRTWVPDLPEHTSASIAVMRVPPFPEVPEPLRGQTVAHLRFCHLGDVAEGEALLAPMRAAAPAMMDAVGPMRFVEADSIHQDPDHPVPFVEQGTLLRELTEDTVEAVLGVAGPQVETPLLMCEIRLLGGALARPAAVPNAVGGRDAAFGVETVAIPMGPAPEAALAAVESTVAALAPWSTGRTMVNFHGVPGDEADRARAWDEPTYQRLCALVRELDPAGMFRFGHAIGR
ncbi:MAG TPA: FAD-binding oxidoreductase [Actinomycetes bacterium]|nr:FAD-binding oxidoreductase [Actinomycetes bacterium]